MVRVATVFSGIGSIEHALNRLNIEHEIVFACDNGERELKDSLEKIKKDTSNMFKIKILCIYYYNLS